MRDALNVLNEAADKYFPNTTAALEAQQQQINTEDNDKSDAEGDSAASVQKKLQDEINALKADARKRKTGRFTALDTVRISSSRWRVSYCTNFIACDGVLLGRERRDLDPDLGRRDLGAGARAQDL